MNTSIVLQILRDEIIEAKKAIKCLYLEVPEEIAQDIDGKCQKVFERISDLTHLYEDLGKAVMGYKRLCAGLDWCDSKESAARHRRLDFALAKFKEETNYMDSL